MQKRIKIIISTLILWLAATTTEGFTSFAAEELANTQSPQASLLAVLAD